MFLSLSLTAASDSTNNKKQNEKLSREDVHKLFYMKDDRQKLVIDKGDQVYLRMLMRGLEKNMYQVALLENEKKPLEAAQYIKKVAQPNLYMALESLTEIEPGMHKFVSGMATELDYWRTSLLIAGNRKDEITAEELQRFNQNKEDNHYRGGYTNIMKYCVDCHQKYELE